MRLKLIISNVIYDYVILYSGYFWSPTYPRRTCTGVPDIVNRDLVLEIRDYLFQSIHEITPVPSVHRNLSDCLNDTRVQREVHLRSRHSFLSLVEVIIKNISNF